ncbi:MAG: hypothetical protein H7A38_02270 [Chlamydiales bacterium]|nr:hypothetical protein [Chlamydiales bacterium]
MKHSALIALTSLLTPMLLFSAPRVNETSPPPPKGEMTHSITPDYGPLPGHRADFVADAEFLWWFPNMSNTDYALKRKGVLQNSDSLTVINPATDKEEFNWSWDPGFRFGVGVVTSHDGWDAYLNWTYFHSRASERKQVAPFTDAFQDINVGTITCTSPWFLNPHDNPYSRIRADIALNFNQVDLEKGRHFWISQNLSLRPSYGIRGYWTRINMSVKGSNDLESQTVEDGTFVNEASKMKQKSWGIGLLAGLESVWHFYSYFSVYATADIALTYGNLKTSKHMSGTEDAGDNRFRPVSHTLHDQFYRMQPIFDLALGFRFESTLYNDAFRLLFDLGYEYHYLYDHVQFLRGTNNFSQVTDQVAANGDLSMSGLVLRGRFEF